MVYALPLRQKQTDMTFYFSENAWRVVRRFYIQQRLGAQSPTQQDELQFVRWRYLAKGRKADESNSRTGRGKIFFLSTMELYCWKLD